MRLKSSGTLGLYEFVPANHTSGRVPEKRHGGARKREAFVDALQLRQPLTLLAPRAAAKNPHASDGEIAKKAGVSRSTVLRRRQGAFRCNHVQVSHRLGEATAGKELQELRRAPPG